MVRIRGAVVLRQMARIAVLGRAGEVSTRVALTALQATMSARQRKLRFRVIEDRPGPGGRRMTLGAISREPGLLMVGIGRAVVHRNMAGAAIRRCVSEGAVRMTLRTLHGCVRAGQRERRFRVVKGRAVPISRAMADRTVSREAGLDMIGIRRGVVDRDMARAAVG